MSGAQLLEFGSEPRWGNLSFPDLETRFEKQIDLAKSIPDLDRLIRSIRPLFKNDHYSSAEIAGLKKLRQRAYDRRRHPKFQTTELSKPLTETGETMPIAVSEKISISQPKIENFTQGALRAITSINGEHVVRTAPKLLIWFASTALVSFFLWQQSLALYETAGFTDSVWASAGGILMIVGFAAYHSITRSKLALLLCLYASSYEAYLMISGTVENEHQIQIQTIQTNTDLVFLKEKAAKSLAHYHELKERYDNPETKVFKNDWFVKTHLNPAWQESLADHKELVAKEAVLAGQTSSSHITWLKILYRLGLVFLCMMLVHQFFAVLVGQPEKRVFEN